MQSSEDVFKDINNTDDILSKKLKSPFEKEISKPIGVDVGINELSLNVCKNKPCQKIIFENSMKNFEEAFKQLTK